MYKILQKIADKIIIGLKNAKSLKETEIIYYQGLGFNNVCIKYFNLYLN